MSIKTLLKEFLVAEDFKRSRKLARLRAPLAALVKQGIAAFLRGDDTLDAFARTITKAVEAMGEVDGVEQTIFGFGGPGTSFFIDALLQHAPAQRLEAELRRGLVGVDPSDPAEKLRSFAAFVARTAREAGVGPDSNLHVGYATCFLSFCWHALYDLEVPVFYGTSHKAVKSLVSHAEIEEPEYASRDLGERFRAFIRVARSVRDLFTRVNGQLNYWTVDAFLEWYALRADEAALRQPDFQSQRIPAAVAEEAIARGAAEAKAREAASAAKAAVGPAPAAASASDDALGSASMASMYAGPGADQSAPTGIYEQLDRKSLLADRPADALVGSGSGSLFTSIPKPETAAKPAAAPGTPEPPSKPAAPSDRGGTRLAAPPAAPPETPRPAQPISAPKAEEKPAGEATTPTLPAWSEPDASPPVAAPPAKRPDPYAALASDTFFAEPFLRDVDAELRARGQIVIEGAPGTGKSYLARRLAEAVAGDRSRVIVLQLHAGYLYADLIEARSGASAVIGENGAGAAIPGILRELAGRAALAPEETFAIVLDDLDRVDAVALLGECYALLDDRGSHVILPYSRAPFRLPKNLYIIATSGGGLSDAALRRRFPAVRLEPDAELLSRFLAARRPALGWLGDAFRELNKRLVAEAGARAAIGQGLFLRADLDEAGVQRAWRFDVRPVVDTIFRDPARRADLELHALRGKAREPALAAS